MSRKTRKLMWSVPLMAAFAVVGALAIFIALTPNDAAAQANNPPGKPGTLTATQFASGTPEEEIELKWSAPTTGGSPTHYRIDQSTNGGMTWTALRSNVSDTRFLHTGLKAGETYHYQVFAINGSMVSVKSNTAHATTKAAVKPDKPENLQAEVGPDQNITCNGAATDGGTGEDIAHCASELTITLTWTAPDDPPGAPVIGYVVEYALIETPGSWTRLQAKAGEFEINGATATHMMLDAGRTYRYRVAAYNKTMKVDDAVVPDPNFMSGWATPDTATTLKGAAPPAIDHTAVRVGVSPAAVKLFLYWSPPTDPMGDKVNAYKVEGRPTSKANGSALNFNTDDAIANDTICGPASSGGTAPTNGCPWATIKDNIGRPSGDDINSFEVIARDVNANTRYDAYFTTKANWEYRISAKNRATPQGTTPTTDVDVNRTVDPTADPLVPVEFLLAPASLRVTAPADASNEGRTGLNLRWGKSRTTASTPTDAATYRIEYSNSGPGDPGGYDWMPLGTSENGGSGLAAGVYTPADATAVAAANQMFADDSATVDHTPGVDGDDDLAAGKTRHYRVFAINTGNIMSWPSNQRSETTKYPDKPSMPTGLTALPDSHTSINLSWMAPDATDDDMDGSEEGPSVIVGYYIQYLDEGSSSWTHITMNGSNLITDAKGMPTTMHTDKGLAPGASRDYRIAAVNKIRTTEQRSDWTDLVKGSTVPIPLPNEPSGLVAEAMGAGAIGLTWLEQADQPMDAEVMEYVIEYSPDGKAGTFKTLAMVTDTTKEMVHTIYTDTKDLSPKTERHYRVFAKNAKGISDQPSNVAMATTADAMVPGAPTGLMATKDATNGTSQINLSWTAPANNGGADIMRYIIERRYTGDGMGAIPSDGYSGTDGANRSFAFSNHMEWWETLNCKGMLAAAGSTEDHTMDSADKTMYCQHYDMTAPSNTAGTITAGGATDMAIKALFDKRYELPTGTGTTFMDTGLMAETQYTYRVSAVNAAGRSAWSAANMATTDAAAAVMPIRPTITGNVTVLRNSISVLWDTASNQGAEQIKVALFDLDANGDVLRLAEGYDGNVHTINPAVGNPGAHTFTNVPAGTYKVGVANVVGGTHRTIVSGAVTVQ